MLGCKQRSGAAAACEGLQCVVSRHIAGHAVVRGNLALAVKSVAQVEVTAGNDIGRSGIDTESTEQPRIDPDAVQLIAFTGLPDTVFAMPVLPPRKLTSCLPARPSYDGSSREILQPEPPNPSPE